jgi:hypothetical protein
MTIPTIHVTNGKLTIRINEADEKRFESQGFKRPEPAAAVSEKKPASDKKA